MRLKEQYEKKIIPVMMNVFGYKNKMAVPRVEKIVVSSGFGKLLANRTPDEQKKISEQIVNEITFITGQKAILTKAKDSISAFNVKKGQAVGAKVTLRRKKMYHFLERLINIALPRSKDFKGIKKEWFDEKGNLNIGIREQIAFPEISPEKTKFIFGLQVTIVTNARKKEEAIYLLKMMGFPIK